MGYARRQRPDRQRRRRFGPTFGLSRRFLAKMPDKDGNGEPDPWNNACDCWNLNPKPVCAQDAPNANAHIDLDDQNGQGPENINVQEPQSGKFYHIGVRAWYGKKTVYGLSNPHVKFIWAQLGLLTRIFSVRRWMRATCGTLVWRRTIRWCLRHLKAQM